MQALNNIKPWFLYANQISYFGNIGQLKRKNKIDAQDLQENLPKTLQSIVDKKVELQWLRHHVLSQPNQHTSTLSLRTTKLTLRNQMCWTPLHFSANYKLRLHAVIRCIRLRWTRRVVFFHGSPSRSLLCRIDILSNNWHYRSNVSFVWIWFSHTARKVTHYLMQ